MAEATRDPRAAAALLARAKRVLITSHAAPDGDAVGSELALAELAGQLGIEAAIVNRDPHPASLDFLPGLEQVRVQPALPVDFPATYDLVVVLECPGLDRPGLAGLDRLPILNIDHHLANERYGEVNYLDEDAPAVGEMIAALAGAAGGRLTATMATNLYVALATDTGDFRYSNATPRAFRAAAELVAAGAEPHRIAAAMWENTPSRVVRLTAAVLSTLELLNGGRVAVITCDGDTLERTGAEPRDTEDLINHARAISGVRVAAFFKAFTPGQVKVSLRSKGEVDVQAIARRFGGGGHPNAAGCTLEGSLAAARSAVLPALAHLVEVT